VRWVTWLSRSHEFVSSSHLIDEHLRELPFLVQGRDEVIRDHAYTVEHEERKWEAREEGRLPNFPVSPGMFRDRTQEDIEELRRGTRTSRALPGRVH
jgi:hypothetical protein